MSMNNYIELAVQRASFWVWHQLRKSRGVGVQLGEESITDFYLLDLKYRAEPWLNIRTFTRQEERNSGGDWEMWLTGPSGNWLGIRIQAKVLNFASMRFEQLHASRRGHSQLHTLVDDSHLKQVIPLYCLYGNWERWEHQRLLRDSPKKQGIGMAHWGTSILSVYDAQELQNNSQNSLCQVFPYTWFLLSLFGVSHSKFDLPQCALDVLDAKDFVRALDGSRLSHQQVRSTYLHNSPPNDVRRLLETDMSEYWEGIDDSLGRVTVIEQTDPQMIR